MCSEEEKQIIVLPAWQQTKQEVGYIDTGADANELLTERQQKQIRPR